MFRTLITLAACALTAGPLLAQTPVATFDFRTGLQSKEGNAVLTAVDPLQTSGFGTEMTYGQIRPVYHFNGNSTPANQGGLTLSTAGLLPSNQYSVEMVVRLPDRPNGWRRLIDVENRLSDAGFYVDPGNRLDIYPVVSGGPLFSVSSFHHVVLTVAPPPVAGANSQTAAYLDGQASFTHLTNSMNIQNANNPNRLMHFFLDNIQSGGQGEWSRGTVALIRIFDSTLTAAQAAALAQNPFDARRPGDVDGDGAVDLTDFALLVQAFDSVQGDANYNLAADFNNDGAVDLSDFAVLAQNFD